MVKNKTTNYKTLEAKVLSKIYFILRDRELIFYFLMIQQAVYRLDVCISSNTCVETKYSTWGYLEVRFSEVIRSWVMSMEPSWMALVPLKKKRQRATSSFPPCQDTARRSLSISQEAAPHQTLNVGPDLGLLFCWNYEKEISGYRPPSLWYFVTAVQAKIVFGIFMIL